MKHLILGFGSIGKRHYRNLKILTHPEDEIVTVDPDPNSGADYRKWNSLLAGWVVYICTPTDNHISILFDAVGEGARAVFVEKPLGLKGEQFGTLKEIPIVCGYNYRFHSEYQSLYNRGGDISLMNVIGVENMTEKYGHTALETMLSHYLDLGLWLFGVPKSVQVVNRGWCATASLNFPTAHLNIYSQIDGNYRRAQAEVVFHSGGYDHFGLIDKSELDAMYVKQMIAWLNFLETGERGQLCFLEDALKVQRLMAEAK